MIICLETPDSILNDDGVDIIDEVFDSSSYGNVSIMKQALWARYRYACIGSACRDRWIQAMKDRLFLVGDKWDDIMDAAVNAVLTDLSALKYNRIIKHEPIGEGDIRTVSHTGQDVITSESEDLPQTPIGTEKYLSNRDTTTTTPGVTDTEKFKPNTQDSEEYAEDRDLEAETFAKMIRSYPNILEGFAAEFGALFVEILP